MFLGCNNNSLQDLQSDIKFIEHQKEIWKQRAEYGIKEWQL